MKRLLTFALLLTSMISIASAADLKNSRPNVILIYADDLGWQDVGYHQLQEETKKQTQARELRLQTPVLDQLAAESILFTNAYACGANCAPSRACLLSGQYTPRHGLFAVGNTKRGPTQHQRVEAVPNKEGLAASNVTMTEVFQQAGYATGHFGKWHLAGRDGAKPSEQGFAETFDSFGDGKLKEGTETNRKGPATDPKGVFTLTDKACDFISRHQTEPFFCYVAHHAIHTPLQGQEATVERFLKADLSKAEAMYAACTSDLDESVGRLLKHLDQLQLRDKTIVIFTSDNGATQQMPQEPLRGSKGGYYEGGIRIPWLINWPGKISPRICQTPVIQVDVYATCLDLVGVKAAQPIDGESLLPLLQGESQLNRDAIFWHFPGYLNGPVIRGRPLDVETGFRTRPVTVMRSGDWKLHLFWEEWLLDGGWDKRQTNNCCELYNLASDVGETDDLAAEMPEVRDHLLKKLLDWTTRIEAPMPSPR